MKRCPNCNTEKEEYDFYVDKKTRDGLTNWCKLCRNEYSRNYRNEKKYWNSESARKTMAKQMHRDSIRDAHRKRCKSYGKTERGKEVKRQAYRKFYYSSKGRISHLKQRLKKTKKESTKIRLQNEIEEIQKQITT